MKKVKLDIADNLKERNTTVNTAFPFRIEETDLSNYEQNGFAVHWHMEIEITLILEGILEYQANGTKIFLKEGESIFINAGTLHSAKAEKGSSCHYLAFILDPILIYGYKNSLIDQKYINPLTASTEAPFYILKPSRQKEQTFIRLLFRLWKVWKSRQDCRELHIGALLMELWAQLYSILEPQNAVHPKAVSADILRLKQALSFIHAHYTDSLTLKEIADSCTVSKSECCHLFQRTLNQSPFSYLLSYRIQKSLPLLMEQTRTITEISEQLGFCSASYFSELFKRHMGFTPREYRKKTLHLPVNP